MSGLLEGRSGPYGYTRRRTYDNISISGRAKASLGDKFASKLPFPNFRARHCYLYSFFVAILILGIALVAILVPVFAKRDQGTDGRSSNTSTDPPAPSSTQSTTPITSSRLLTNPPSASSTGLDNPSTITAVTTVSVPTDDPRYSTFYTFTCQWGCPGRRCTADSDCGKFTASDGSISELWCDLGPQTCAWP